MKQVFFALLLCFFPFGSFQTFAFDSLISQTNSHSQPEISVTADSGSSSREAETTIQNHSYVSEISPLSQPTAPPPTQFVISEYFPLQTGNRWNLKQGSETQTIQITGTKTINGVKTFIAKTFTGIGAGEEDYYTVNAQGFQLHGQQFSENGQTFTIFFDQSLLICPSDLQIGNQFSDSSTFTFDGLNGMISSQTYVISTENVTGANGAIFKDALRLLITFNITLDGQTDTQTYQFWMAKGLGIIKQTVPGFSAAFTIHDAIVHYSSGRKRVELFDAPKDLGISPDLFIYAEYLDENFNNSVIGRIVTRRRLDGSYDKITYWNFTSKIKSLHRYDADGNISQLQAFYEDTTPWLPADANLDRRVNLTDFGLLKNNFGKPGVWPEDANGDGRIDLTDFGLLKQNFGRTI